MKVEIVQVLRRAAVHQKWSACLERVPRPTRDAVDPPLTAFDLLEHT